MNTVDKVAVTAMMMIAVYTDIRRGKIYNALTLSFFAGGLLLRIFSGEAAQIPGIFGATALLVALLYPFCRAGGLGAGDIKLFAAAGTFTGPVLLAQCVGLAFLIGGAVAAVLLLMGRGPGAKIHFAVPIAISTLSLILCPELQARIAAWSGIL